MIIGVGINKLTLIT